MIVGRVGTEDFASRQLGQFCSLESTASSTVLLALVRETEVLSGGKLKIDCMRPFRGEIKPTNRRFRPFE